MLKQITGLLLAGTFSLSAIAAKLPADPTQPAQGFVVAVEKQEVANEFLVSSLVTGKRKNSAVVNGQRVNVGDTVDGAEVVAISRRGVVLSINNQQKTVTLAGRSGLSKVKSGK